MSSDEIIHILRQLYELGCPSEILGCNPSKSDEKEVSNIIETGCNLLLQPSQDKLELLKWIDSQIFSDITAENLDTSNKKHLAGFYSFNHLSCLISADSDGLFGQGSQDKARQLSDWKILLRALNTINQLQNTKNIDDKYDEAKRYMVFLSNEGCAIPVKHTSDSITKQTTKKGLTEKASSNNTKSIMIPRDLEKDIRTGKRPNFNAIELQTIRDNVVAEASSLQESNLSDNFNKSHRVQCNENDARQLDETTKLSDVMKNMENTCTSFKNLYLNDLQGWVNRTPKVETNSELEQTTKELSILLANIHERTDAISTIRSSLNSISSKSRELDSYLG